MSIYVRLCSCNSARLTRVLSQHSIMMPFNISGISVRACVVIAINEKSGKQGQGKMMANDSYLGSCSVFVLNSQIPSYDRAEYGACLV